MLVAASAGSSSHQTSQRLWSLAAGIYQQEALYPVPPARTTKTKAFYSALHDTFGQLHFGNIQQCPAGRLQICFIAISLHSSQKFFWNVSKMFEWNPFERHYIVFPVSANLWANWIYESLSISTRPSLAEWGCGRCHHHVIVFLIKPGQVFSIKQVSNW